MSTNDQIREAFAELAARAPAPDRLAAGIADRTRAIRQRRLLLGAGGTVAAAVALGVPALLWWPPRDPSTADELLGPIRGRGYPMPFTPSWLPDGYLLTEQRVTTDVPGPQRREWTLKPPNLFPRIRLELALGSTAPWPSSSTVDINGLPGLLTQSKYSAACTWQPFIGIEMSVSFADDPDDTDRGAEFAEVVLRVARSTSLSRVEYLQPTMRFGWLPDQVPLRRTFERLDLPNGAGDMASAYTTTGQTRRAIYAGVSSELNDSIRLEDAEKTTLRGRPAWYFPPHPQAETPGPGSFVVELADGKWLFTATNPAQDGPVVPKDDLARITEMFHVGLS